MTKNEIDRQRILRDTEAYLARGGEIHTVTAFDNREAGVKFKRVKSGQSTRVVHVRPDDRNSQPRVK